MEGLIGRGGVYVVGVRGREGDTAADPRVGRRSKPGRIGVRVRTALRQEKRFHGGALAA